MWETINQLPIWLKAILIIAPMGAIIGLAVALVIKIIKSEKIKIGKEGINLEDTDDKQEVADEIKS